MADDAPAPTILNLVKRSPEPDCVTAVAHLLPPSSGGGSRPYQVRGSDGKRYWCKGLDNGQIARVPINEQIVGRLGRLIGAAVCEVRIVNVPAELREWEPTPGRKVTVLPGFASGSLAVENAIEIRGAVRHPNDDNNPTRLTSLSVLAHWCFASDAQWMCATTEENRYYSHDHGHYFPSGPGWSVGSLAGVGPTSTGGFPAVALAKPELQRLADVLATIDDARIAACIGGLPDSWPVTEEELERLVTYLEQRRIPLVERLRKQSEAA